jgi:tRNA (guanine37-N1)-methyltransferase
VRTWSVVVPRDRAEEVRRELLAKGLLLKHLRIGRDGDRILLPTADRVDVGFPTAERDFAEGFVAIRSYKDVIKVPDAVRRSLPSSFDVVGDVALIKLPEDLRPHRTAIGAAILRWNPKIRVVLEDRGVATAHRVRRVEVIGGERRTTTVHVEHGLRYRVDLARAYFSPRLATERMRIADSTRDGEIVADPFAGVGPYAILMARRARPRVVYAADTNPAAVDLLRANVAANRADRVEVREGDARAILQQIAPVDRVILDLPHSALDFLPDALGALGPSGTVHLYGILERAEEPERERAVREVARSAGFRVTKLTRRAVRAYSPTQYHTAFDVTVARA